MHKKLTLFVILISNNEVNMLISITVDRADTYTWVTSIYLNPNKIINRKNYQLSSIGGIKNNDIFAS